MESALKQGKILILDDQVVNVKILERLLHFNGFQNLIVTTESRETFAIIQREKPNLILLDLEMPYVTGFDILLKLQEINQKQEISVIVLTANQDKESSHRALDLGANDFLSKPFDSKEVMLRIINTMKSNIYNRLMASENEKLNYLVELKTHEIRESQFEIIRRLGTAAEFKDNETAKHTIRMSKYCEVMAYALGLNDEQCRLILHASPMHDIGKIGIPDYILLKPGKLSDEERVIMNTHAEIGGRIIGDHSSSLLIMARIIAETHHEKWDGSGYPQGLKGEEIPLEGRITAITDVFDALTSERPYKKAWSVDEAIQFLIQNKGQHFEPSLVDLFLKNLDQIISIKKEFQD